MHLVLIGLSYKSTPIGLRERLSITKAQLGDALSSLASLDEVCECAILSTCNRTEIYAYTSQRDSDEAIVRWIGEYCGVPADVLAPHVYTCAGHKAAEHLFRVAAGMDSMVLGETQILGQVKDAYAAAATTVGTVLNPLFQQAVVTGKKVVSKTEIGRGVFSVGSAAARLARSVFGQLTSSTLLVVGAGKMAELTTSHLASLGVGKLLVTNRTYERALGLATRFKGQVVRYDDLASALEKADIVVTSTGSDDRVITREMICHAMRARRGRPMFIVDVAVPRDVDETAADLDNVFLYNIDDLETVVEANDVSRRAEIQKAECIVAEEVEEFNRWFRELDVVPVITALREKFERIRQAEMDRLSRRLQHLKPEDMAAISAAMDSVVNKICHEPVIQIKECAAAPNSSAKLEAMCEAFGLCPSGVAKPREKSAKVG